MKILFIRKVLSKLMDRERQSWDNYVSRHLFTIKFFSFAEIERKWGTAFNQYIIYLLELLTVNIIFIFFFVVGSVQLLHNILNLIFKKLFPKEYQRWMESFILKLLSSFKSLRRFHYLPHKRIRLSHVFIIWDIVVLPVHVFQNNVLKRLMNLIVSTLVARLIFQISYHIFEKFFLFLWSTFYIILPFRRRASKLVSFWLHIIHFITQFFLLLFKELLIVQD